MIVCGALAQAGFEMAVVAPVAARAAAIGLVTAVVVINCMEGRRFRWPLAAVLLAALPLWWSHAGSVLRALRAEPTGTAAVAPTLLVFGTLFLCLIETEPNT